MLLHEYNSPNCTAKNFSLTQATLLRYMKRVGRYYCNEPEVWRNGDSCVIKEFVKNALHLLEFVAAAANECTQKCNHLYIYKYTVHFSGSCILAVLLA